MIISRAPFRISFFGGGTDYPSWYEENNGLIVSTSIQHYCYISLRKLPPFFGYRNRVVWSKVENISRVEDIEHPVVRAILQEYGIDGMEIHHTGDLPSRSGLGSSSSFTVSLIKAVEEFLGKAPSNEEIVSKAVNVEQVKLKEVVGIQDQIATSYGGFNQIRISKEGGYDLIPINIGSDNLRLLESSLFLVYSGSKRFSSDVASLTVNSISIKSNSMNKIFDLAEESIKMFENNFDLKNFAELLNETWSIKKSIGSFISNNQIDEIFSKGISAGAFGGKLLGAGGGGFLLFVVPEISRSSFFKKLKDFLIIPLKFDTDGVQIVFNKLTKSAIEIT